MLWRDNSGDDKPTGENRTEIEKQKKAQEQSTTVQKAYDDVQKLKEKIEALKAQTAKLSAEKESQASQRPASGTAKTAEKASVNEDAVAAAERAVMEHAKQDIRESAQILQRETSRDVRIRASKQKEREAIARFEQKKREAEEKQRQLEEAEKRAAQMRELRHLAEIQSTINKNARMEEHREAIDKQQREEARLREIEKEIEQERRESARRAAERVREEQERIEREKAHLEKEREKKLREQEREAKRQAAIDRRNEIIRQRQEEQRRREERERAIAEEKERLRIAREKEKAERERKIREQKELERRKREEEKAERERKTREYKALERVRRETEKAERERIIRKQKELERKKREKEKAEKEQQRILRELIKSEERHKRKQRITQERREKNELRRKRKIAQKAAELGGGLVNIHGTTVKTEIQPVAAFSIREILGIVKKKEINAAVSEKERQALLEKSEKIKAEARATMRQLAEVRKARRQRNPFYRRVKRFFDFCEKEKKPLLILFSLLLTIAIGGAGVLNYYTVYEYSYNGRTLGYVKSKDDVLQITEMVQSALTAEKNIDVVIDARKDIDFDRVHTINKDITVDSTDDVLRRLTYMGDINIKAYGIYVDGRKAGAVETKDAAANVLKGLTDRYASHKKGAAVKEAAVVENIEIRKSNTSLEDMDSEESMLDKLCRNTERESLHTVTRGETLASIAQDNNITESEILKYNEGISTAAPEAGSTLIIHQNAPLVTVRITEVREHKVKTDYKTIKKEDKELYEGFTETDNEGEKGTSVVTDRYTSLNGKIIENETLKNEVKKKPTDKVVRVGTKERPPTVGSGTYIWPAYEGTYTVTSEFKWRWGRQHEGIDMGCSTGTDVLAADGGTVVHAGWMGGYGNLVIIDHQNGVQTYYGHNSALCVNVGDKVFQGQHIAEAGNTGNSFGSHIHFGVKVNGTFENPRNYLP